jgi:Transposase
MHQAVADRFHVMVQINKELDMQRKKSSWQKVKKKSWTIRIYWQSNEEP